MNFARSLCQLFVVFVSLSVASCDETDTPAAVLDATQTETVRIEAVTAWFNAVQECFNQYSARPFSLANCFISVNCFVLGPQAGACTGVTFVVQKILNKLNFIQSQTTTTAAPTSAPAEN